MAVYCTQLTQTGPMGPISRLNTFEPSNSRQSLLILASLGIEESLKRLKRQFPREVPLLGSVGGNSTIKKYIVEIDIRLPEAKISDLNWTRSKSQVLISKSRSLLWIFVKWNKIVNSKISQC